VEIKRYLYFSNPEKNPFDVDPRSKRQIEEYWKKTVVRQKLLSAKKQHQAYREVLGNEVPKDFAKFQELKYIKSEKWEYTKGLKKYIEKYPISDKRFYERAFFLQEGRHDPAQIMTKIQLR